MKTAKKKNLQGKHKRMLNINHCLFLVKKQNVLEIRSDLITAKI